MVDREIVADKLRHTNEYTNDLKEMRGLTRENYVTDTVTQRAVERTFVNLIQSCIDLAQHIRATEDLSPSGTAKKLVGILRDGGEITESYASGDVTGDSFAGGLAGEVKSGATVADSYALGDVEVTNLGAGGFTGVNGGDVDTSYSTGDNKADPNNIAVGGFIGGESGSVSDGYWDEEASTQSTDTGSGDISSITALQTGPGICRAAVRRRT